jgi:hypothetical protein
MNLSWGSLPPICFEQASAINRREGRSRPPNEVGVRVLRRSVAEGRHQRPAQDDVGAQRSGASTGRASRLSGLSCASTPAREFTTRIIDLIGVKDRKYLDATATHRNRGPEDIARYAILVTVADDGAIGSHTFMPERRRKLRWRNSDEALLALGRFIYSCSRPPIPTVRTS